MELYTTLEEARHIAQIISNNRNEDLLLSVQEIFISQTKDGL